MAHRAILRILLLLAGAGGVAAQDGVLEALHREAETLVERLGDDAWAVREDATLALCRLGSPALPVVRRVLDHDDLEVRSRARFLERLLEWDLTPRLWRDLDAPGDEVFLEREAANNLIPTLSAAGPEGVQVLAMLFHRSDDGDLRFRAFWAAAGHCEPETLAFLERRARIPGFEDYLLLAAKCVEGAGDLTRAAQLLERATGAGAPQDLLDLCLAGFFLACANVPEALRAFEALPSSALRERFLDTMDAWGRDPAEEFDKTTLLCLLLYTQGPRILARVEAMILNSHAWSTDTLRFLSVVAPHAAVSSVLGDVHRLNGRREEAARLYLESAALEPRDLDRMEKNLRSVLADKTVFTSDPGVRLWRTYVRLANPRRLTAFVDRLVHETKITALDACRLSGAAPATVPDFFSAFEAPRFSPSAARGRGGRGVSVEDVLPYAESPKPSLLAVLLLASHHIRNETIEAMAWARKAFELAPESAPAFEVLLRAVWLDGRLEEFPALYERAARYDDPGRISMRLVIRNRYLTEDSPKARRAAFLLVGNLPDGGEALAVGADLHARASVEEVERWEWTDPKTLARPGRAAFALALARRAKGDWEKALAWFERAERRGADPTACAAGILEAEANLSRPDAAVETSFRWLAARPGADPFCSMERMMRLGFPALHDEGATPALMAQLAILEGAPGERALAVALRGVPETHRAAMEARFAREPSAALALAVALARGEDPAWIAKAFALDPADPRIRLLHLKALLAAGDAEGARRAFRPETAKVEVGGVTFDVLLDLVPLLKREDVVPLLDFIAAAPGPARGPSIRLALRCAGREDLPYLAGDAPGGDRGLRRFLAGAVLEGLGEEDRARAAFAEAREAGFAAPYDLAWGAELLAEGRWLTAANVLGDRRSDAIHTLQAACRNGEPRAVLLLVELLERRVDIDAPALLKLMDGGARAEGKALLSGRGGPVSRMLLGWILHLDGDEEGATACFADALAQRPRSAGVVYSYVELLKAAEVLEGARSLYRRLLPAGDEGPEDHAGLRANVLSILSFRRAFFPLVEEALQDPSPSVAIRAAHCWAREATEEDAKRILFSEQRAEPAVRIALGEFYEDRPDTASNLLKRVLGDPEARRAFRERAKTLLEGMDD